MIIKSHVRGGYRSAAEYLQETGKNEKTRLVEISDPGAADLDEAFRNMWTVAGTTRARKPLHHVSVNPYKDERLTDAQVLRICARLEQKYGYAHGEHQRVIVEHVKDGRQHFHVMWNRISLHTGRPVWPGHHWNKSKQAAREMEVELGLKRPVPRRAGRRRAMARARTGGQREARKFMPVRSLFRANRHTWSVPPYSESAKDSRQMRICSQPIPRNLRRCRVPQSPHPAQPVRWRRFESWEDWLIAWAWENRRSDILARFGIYISFDL